MPCLTLLNSPIQSVYFPPSFSMIAPPKFGTIDRQVVAFHETQVGSEAVPCARLCLFQDFGVDGVLGGVAAQNPDHFFHCSNSHPV
jgi:hypothetical protein